MAEKQIPVAVPSTKSLSAPPALQSLADDGAAGLCVDGYCVLPTAKSAPAADGPR